MDNFNSIGSSIPKAKVPQKSGINAWDIAPGSNAFCGSNDASLFSSSLPVLWHEKLNFMDSDRGVRLMDDTLLKMKNVSDDVEGKLYADDVNHRLPDEEDLLAGIMDDLDLSGLPTQVEELEEYDLFGSLGGLEMDSDPKDITVGLAKAGISEGYLGNGIAQYNLPNGVGTIAGEHPYGEHPSRTLFVRNINSNVEDSELRILFEQYGDIRSLYTACKHRGFVMISYYDIRSARSAMRALQNKPLRRRKLDIHFSIPKDNPSDKDMNQGTLVIFNLDPSVTNDDLRQIFGAYGEVKEIRETPHKRHHKFIEFYDVRAAEAALKSLNKSDIAGKRIKLEPSRPGGARRNLMQQLTHEFEPDESRVYRHHVGSPITSSPPGTWLQFGSPSDGSPLQAALSKSPTGVSMGPIGSNHLPDLVSVISPMSNSMKISPIGKDQNRLNQADQTFSGSGLSHGSAFQGSRSISDHGNGLISSSPGTLGASPTNASAVGTLSGPQFLWGSPTTYGEQPQSSSWQSRANSYKANGQGQGQNFLYPSTHGSFTGSSHNQHHYQVGSAPSVLPFERRYGYIPESPETSFMNQVAYGNVGAGRTGGSLMMNMSPRATMNSGIFLPGNMANNSLPNLRMMSSQRLGPSFLGGVPYAGLSSLGLDGFYDRSRNRRVDYPGSQLDNKKQYQLDLDKIAKGEDTRTTLMIKNIPNKYTSKMLLAAIDEHHKGTYDFLYLPIDFKNKCNVGYAFINMVSPSHIISFYEVFNGKKWEKFNSEKVASLAYARIQGRPALIAHFQNSSLMNEDKRCRPILFDAEGSETIDQEIFSLSDLNTDMCEPDGFSFEEDLYGSPERSNPTENSKKSSLPIIFG